MNRSYHEEINVIMVCSAVHVVHPEGSVNLADYLFEGFTGELSWTLETFPQVGT